MSDLRRTASPLMPRDSSFRATPPENSMRRLAQIRLLPSVTSSRQPMDATETADDRALKLTHQHRQPTSRSLAQTNGSQRAANDTFAHILRVGGGSFSPAPLLWLPAVTVALFACGTDGLRRIGENHS